VKKIVKIVFFGTPEIAATVLSQLVTSGIEIVGVVTKPDVAKGRSSKLVPSSVKEKAVKLLPDVCILDPVKCSTGDTVDALKKLQADLFVVVAYGEIVSQDILDVAPKGAINMHASLLPKYRGAAPMQRALMDGQTHTGVSIIRMVRKMDAGAILSQETIEITPNMTLGELESVMAKLGAHLLIKTIGDIEKNQVHTVQQDESQATFAKKIEPHEAEIFWDRPCETVHNQIRALSPHPGAYCFVTIRGQKKRLKVYRSEGIFIKDVSVYSSKEYLLVKCQDGMLALDEIQLEGKPVIKAKEFLQGTPSSEICFQ